MYNNSSHYARQTSTSCKTSQRIMHNKPAHHARQASTLCKTNQHLMQDKPAHSTPLPTGEGLGVGLQKSPISPYRHTLHDHYRIATGLSPSVHVPSSAVPSSCSPATYSYRRR